MRIDLFLKKSGIVKRRKIAHDLCISGNVEINNLPAKPSKNIKEGDLVRIVTHEKILKVKIIDPEAGRFQIIEN